MNQDTFKLVILLITTLIVISVVLFFMFTSILEAFTNYRNRCTHSNRYFDGDTMTIRCSECNEVIVSIVDTMSLEEFINQ